MYDVHLELTGKRVLDFLLVLIELLSLGVTAEALQAKTDRKSVHRKGMGHQPPNFHVEGDVPTNLFHMDSNDNECLTICRRQFSHKDTL